MLFWQRQFQTSSAHSYRRESPSNVTCVDYSLLNVDTWRDICAFILGNNVLMRLVWIRFKGHSGTGELVQWRFSRSDNFKTHTRTHTWETSKCDMCHSVVYAFPKIFIWTCAFILGSNIHRNVSNVTWVDCGFLTSDVWRHIVDTLWRNTAFFEPIVEIWIAMYALIPSKTT